MASEKIEIIIDDKPIRIPPGTTILQAAQKLGIKIPTLCNHKDLFPSGICRICLVEIEGQKKLQTSCCYQITNPIKVKTFSPQIRKARKNILELLLAKHNGECTNCPRNKNCELQALADQFGITESPFGKTWEKEFPIDTSSFGIARDMNKCILCRRCVRTCNQLQEIGALKTVNRGNQSEIAAFANIPLAQTICINCGQCINRCPTGALYANDNTQEVWRAIEDPRKHVVIQTAPSPRAGIGEIFGLPPGVPLTKELNTALRRVGFNKVFDTNFSADLTIIEEVTEFLLRCRDIIINKTEKPRLPLFTSCSPGWIKFLEHFYPEFIPHLSTCKSPQQMFGAIIKTYYAQTANIDPENIVSVALMPCTAKKFECNRPEMKDSGFKDVDYGLTTRELGKMIKQAGIHLPDMPKEEFDAPFGTETGSGVIFGATGGVMESALRTAIELATYLKFEDLYPKGRIIPVRGFRGTKIAEITFPNEIKPVPELLKTKIGDWSWLSGLTIKVAVCHGTKNARKVLESIKNNGKFSDCHFIEFMACPGGCLGGGGQPIPTTSEIRKKRAQAIYKEDKRSEVRKSYQNPAVLKIYNEFIKEGPGSKLAHKLLHTSYTSRGIYLPNTLK
jgi:NADH-quinone oxidoreductase subunit G/[NiFe] hydrogenase diaphorase moiety small subunit